LDKQEHRGTSLAPGKMMCGAAGVVRLVSTADVGTGLSLAVGIETSLALMQGFSWRPAWPATSAGMIRAVPVLAAIEALTIFADSDGAGMTAAEGYTARWGAAESEARICIPPAGNFNGHNAATAPRDAG
jgi:hypothetical protein